MSAIQRVAPRMKGLLEKGSFQKSPCSRDYRRRTNVQ